MILVFDFFAGLGGLSRALELAEVKIDRLVVVEKDPACRRLNSVRWPGCDIWLDIEKVTKKEVERMMRSVPGLTGVVAGGGSPCQGLSRLSANREHLADPRSQLFYKYTEILGWIEEMAEEMRVWCLLMLENVVGDDEDIEEMTGTLGSKPLLVCSSGLSRVRRPRLYWSNVALEDHGSFTREHFGLYDAVVFEEHSEPIGKVADEGWKWTAGEEDDQLKLPTFTRAIPRRKPPVEPAGLKSCDEATVRLWQGDRMKFPPYTYLPQYLFEKQDGSGSKRVASVGERERLMGFPTGYTLALHKKEPQSEQEKIDQTVEREAALGNSFHTVTVACLLDLWLWSMQVRTDPMGAKAIVEKWHEAMDKQHFDDFGLIDVEGVKASEEFKEPVEEEKVMCLDKNSQRAEWLRLCSHPGKDGDPSLLGVRLVHQYLRRAEFRGSDVRLDLNVAYRPDAMVRTTIDPRRWVWKVAQAWKWQRREHINLLELRCILRTLEWRARSSTFHSCRFLHLSDSQICLSVLAKGRSSSRKINRILRRICALCLALNLYPLWAWIMSKLNPADAPSRKYAEAD